MFAANIALQAFLLADHIYRDEISGKYVVAGTFHQLSVASFPITFGRSIGIFVALEGLSGKTGLELAFVDASNGDMLMEMSGLEITSDNADMPIEFAIEVPPLPLPHAGRYFFQLAIGGDVLGRATIFVASENDNRST